MAKQMKIDTDPLQLSTNYAEPINIMMVDMQEANDVKEAIDMAIEDFEKEFGDVYPKSSETLVEFLLRKKDLDNEVVLCPRCNAVFDKAAAKAFQDSEMKRHYEQVSQQKASHALAKKKISTPARSNLGVNSGQVNSGFIPAAKTFVPPVGVPPNKWVRTAAGTSGSKPNWQVLNFGGPSNLANSNKYFFNQPRAYFQPPQMTRTQLRRAQRFKKAAYEAAAMQAQVQVQGPSSYAQILKRQNLPQEQVKQVVQEQKGKQPMGKQPMEDDDLLTDDFDSGFPDEIRDICGVVSVLPAEFADFQEIDDWEDYYEEKEPQDTCLCYYVMTDEGGKESRAIFHKPTVEMQGHMKPLFVVARVEGVRVNRVLVDGGAAINLMPLFMLKRFDKTTKDLINHNMVLTDYSGKASNALGIIVVEVKVGTSVRSTMFVVVPSKANYNLLLGREWIHGVGAIPSTLHQKLCFWTKNGELEYVEGDHSFFQAEVDIDHLDERSFDRVLGKIKPFEITEENFSETPESILLEPAVGFLASRPFYSAKDRSTFEVSP